MIARVLVRRGVYVTALNHAKEATQLYPWSEFFFFTLGDVHYRLREFDEAIKAIDTAIALSDGKWGIMHFTRGLAYFDLQNWAAAQDSFERAADLDPKDADAAYNVALCLVNLRDSSDAVTWFREALRRNPRFPRSDEAERQISLIEKKFH